MADEQKVTMVPTGSVQINQAIRGIIMPELAAIKMRLESIENLLKAKSTKTTKDT